MHECSTTDSIYNLVVALCIGSTNFVVTITGAFFLKVYIATWCIVWVEFVTISKILFGLLFRGQGLLFNHNFALHV